MKVKNSAIIYTAYEYQTLHGVKLLADWLNSPTRYTRVAFEADRDSNETPQGIDDIVGERPDGIKDFWQVKFTPSPERAKNCLTWDFLLDISGTTVRSRSILKKLYDAILDVPADKLGNVILLTNKLPNRNMEACLSNSKIDFRLVDGGTQVEIIRQLGSHKAAAFLFSKLTVQHSDGDLHTTDRSIRAELLKFSDDIGVERLISKSRYWAMFKDNPPENGWIYLHHVRSILSTKRPEPIPEHFSLPEDYCLPNIDFHNNLLAKINDSVGEVITLTGKPGAGKSTYLSFLCKELEGKEVPLIRHHYFLSLGDTTSDRLSPRIVAESLLYQINSLHKDINADTSKPENLRDALIACADYYKTKGKPFVVLIDGLDHVWRDNARNKKPLDETFRQLIPVVNNLVILVGTQPVDDELLPHILLANSPKKLWEWLPEMSGDAIYEFLTQHIDSGRLFLNCHENYSDKEIQESAKALLEITNGYPLHVIYSSEFLSQNSLALSSWQVKKLPPCSSGNIISYYSELWRNLNYKQKDVLYICSGFQFSWPRQAIGKVVKDGHDCAPSVDAVTHMLSEGVSGIRPFHESLVVFIKNQEEYKERIQALLPSVCDWLSSEAPIHLKDNWLWSSLARSGDSSKLRQGVTRDWVLNKLVIGLSAKSCIRLLSEAETYAFHELNYAEAYQHRELKTRLINGPEFQTWDLTNLEIFSLVRADELSINERISGQNEYSPLKLSILAIALWHRGKFCQAKLLSKKSIDLYQTRTKLLPKEHSQDNEVEIVSLISAGTLTGSLSYSSIFEDGKFFSWPDSFIASFRRASCMKKELSLLLMARNYLPSDSTHIGLIELDAIRLSIIEGADISSRPEYKAFSSQELSNFERIYSKKSFGNVSAVDSYGQTGNAFKVEAATSYHSWFFASLCLRLNAGGDFTWLPASATSDRVDVSIHYDLLNKLVDSVANELLLGNTLNFDTVCAMFPTVSILDDTQWDTHRLDITLKRGWIEIAADCHLITTKSAITRDELKYTIDSGVFKSSWLRLWYKEVGLKLLCDDAAECLIEFETNRQLNELEETIENSNAFLELAIIAYQHDKILIFEKCLKKSWDFVLGYGHHKDPTIFGVLKAVEYLSATKPDSALTILERISSIVYNISDFTDGDETRHSKHSVSSLVAKLNPQTAASMYDQELSDGEWSYGEETILRLLERCDFSLPITQKIYQTGLHASCYQLLREKINNGNSDAIDISNKVESLLGINIQDQEEEKYSKAQAVDEIITLQPSDYPPEHFEELVKALKGNHSTRKFWKAWYAHWTEQGKELELLQQLVPLSSTFSGGLDDKRYLLDLLYLSQRKLNGKAKAFEMLVTAHNAMNGWSEWYESAENSINRLQMVAEEYPQKIDEFIKLTTSQPDSWKDQFGDLIIPNDKLVFLLSHSGRNEEALQLTLKMVESLEDSVRNLQLTKPDWDWQQDDSIEEALIKMLVARVKLPVPSVKLWTIDQLSHLLIEGNSSVEGFLKEELANRKQESECVEMLCVFLAAKSRGYECPANLGCYIKARSTLSDLILSELLTCPVDFGTYAYASLPVINLEGDNHRFDYYQGRHVPHLYSSCLKREEKNTGIPFADYFQSEWNNTYKYQPQSGVSVDYFFGRDRQRATGQFYTQASHRGRSAYLRTIEVAKDFYEMPDSYAEHLSIVALPIEPAYMGLRPQKPIWLPEWDKKVPPNRDSLIFFVEQVLADFAKYENSLDLLALSLPIKINSNHWVDLTIVKAIADPDQINIQLEERSGCFSVGSLMEEKLSYELSNKKMTSELVLAVIPYPLNRYGHWHSDLESRGFYVPKCDADDRSVQGSSKEGFYYYTVDGVQIGYSSFWYRHWQPVHPKGLRSLCGTFTVVEKNKYSKWSKNDEGLNEMYVCNATILKSEESYRECDAEVHVFNVEV